MLARGDQPGDVRHIHHQLGVHRIRDSPKSREIQHARVRARARHDEFRAMLFRKPFHFVVVYRFKLAIYAVGCDIVDLSRKVHRRAVREMAALVKAHPHNGIARLNGCEVRRHIRLRAAVGLHIGVFGGEQRLGAADGEAFGDIHKLAAAVIAPPRIALGVLVGENRALRLQHGWAGVVFGGDKVDVAALPLNFALNGARNLRVLPH